jgi:hypothetical protein
MVSSWTLYFSVALLPLSAVVMAHFQRYFQHFASSGNTRYDWRKCRPEACLM